MFTHEVSLKNRLIIAGVIVAIGWTGSGIYLYRSVKQMKATNSRELEIIDNARKVVMVKAARGEYDDSEGRIMVDKFLSDYEFFKMTERVKGES